MTAVATRRPALAPLPQVPRPVAPRPLARTTAAGDRRRLRAAAGVQATWLRERPRG